MKYLANILIKIKMKYPAFIKKGDLIGITACSDGNTEELDLIRINHAIEQLEQRGYLVIETPNTRQSKKGRSSYADIRVKQLYDLLENRDVRTIIMCKGGDYLCEILSLLDFKKFLQNPKWIQGYSDPTGLLYTITVNTELATIYSSNFGDFGMKVWHKSIEDNLKLLEGNLVKQTSFEFFMDGFRKRETGLEEYFLEEPVIWKNITDNNGYQIKHSDRLNSEVKIRGRLLGGCLDVLLNLVGTKYDKTKEFCHKYKEDGILWYLESFDLNSEQLYLGLWNLKEAGWFDTAKGFLFGRPTFYKSNYDILYEEAVYEVLKSLQVPIILDADFGHKPPRMTIVNGAIGNVVSNKGKGSLVLDFLE